MVCSDAKYYYPNSQETTKYNFEKGLKKKKKSIQVSLSINNNRITNRFRANKDYTHVLFIFGKFEVMSIL